MKLTKLFFSTAACLAAISFTSCSEDEGEKPAATAEVMKLEAKADFDLKNRKDWVLTVGGQIYNYTVAGNSITGTPTEKPAVVKENEPLSVSLRYQPANAQKRDEQMYNDEFIDQSTWDMFMYQDRVMGTYNGSATANVSGVVLSHACALIDFTFTGLPDDATLYIGQSNWKPVIPLRDETNNTAYKAIVLPQTSFTSLHLIIKSGDITEYKPLVFTDENVTRAALNSTPPKFFGGAVITFKAHINDNNEIVIEDLKADHNAKWTID